MTSKITSTEKLYNEDITELKKIAPRTADAVHMLLWGDPVQRGRPRRPGRMTSDKLLELAEEVRYAERELMDV